MGAATHTHTFRDMVVTIEEGGQRRRWSLQAHILAMEVGTDSVKNKMAAMYEMVKSWRHSREGSHPDRTTASYVFQEAEGISRLAKLWWARVRGHKVQNLQHDGVILTTGTDIQPQAVARAMTAVCTHALGYAQPVATDK